MPIKSLLIAIAITYSTTCFAGFFGPDKFKIIQADNRFSEKNIQVVISKNNRISKKSVAGGKHIDAKGVFIDPIVTMNGETGDLLEIAFGITNFTDYDTAYGAPNSLGNPKEISFLVNGSKPIVLPIKLGDSSWSDRTSYNSASRSASTDIIESGLASLTLEQYQEIASSTSLAVRIIGDKRIVTYESKDISKTFIPNIREFLEKVLVKK